MAQSLSKIHIRMNAFALPGRTNENTINTQGVASLALGYAQSWAFSPPRLPFVASSSQDLRMMISRLMTSLRSVGLRTSLPPCGQWGYAESREIPNARGVSLSRHSVDYLPLVGGSTTNLVRFVFLKNQRAFQRSKQPCVCMDIWLKSCVEKTNEPADEKRIFDPLKERKRRVDLRLGIFRGAIA